MSAGTSADIIAAPTPQMSMAHIATCVAATAATPRILPVMSWKGETLDTSTSSTRLPFSSMTEVMTIEP